MCPGSRRRQRAWLTVATGISVLCLAATAAVDLRTDWGAWQDVVHTLDLGAENGVAVWWSGMLLLLASLHAFDGADRSTDHPRAWSVIAAILLFFSADEVASLHERIGHVAWAVGYSEWVPLGALALVLGGAAIVSLGALWRRPDRRPMVLGLWFGLMLMASAAPQEYVEHLVTWSSRGARAARVVLEEGSELGGTLVVLGAILPLTMSAGATPERRAGGVPFAALRTPGRRAVVYGAVFCVALALITASLPDQQRGHPADWLAATCFLSASLVLLRPDVRGGEGNVGEEDAGRRSDRREDPARGARRGQATIGVLASAAAVAVPPVALVEAGPFWWNVRLTILSVLGGLLAAMGVLRLRRGGGAARERGRHWALLAAMAALTMCVAIALSLDLFLSYLSTALLGFAAYTATARTRERRPVV